jgi:site-specific recombinase XerD
MALERFWEWPSALHRLRDCVLGPIFDGFCQWLLDQGYAPATIRMHIRRACHFDDYLRRVGIADIKDLRATHVEEFLTYGRRHYPCPRGGFRERIRVQTSIRCLRKYLKVSGQIQDLPSMSRTPPHQVVLDEFLAWMKDYCQCSARTLDERRRYLIPFLEHLGADALRPQRLSKLSPQTLQDFVLDCARRSGNSTPAHLATSLRMFCRFCLHRGYVTRDLAGAVPSFRQYRLRSIPGGIAAEDADRLLRSIDRASVAGRRDYAILQLLHTYGVRSQQVGALRLRDIQWGSGQVRFMAMKHGKSVAHPLTNDVGDSLLAYLRDGRPACQRPEVFLTVKAPYGPVRHGSISHIVSSRMQAAGLSLSVTGARAFRHGFASRMLAAGYPLKSIADMLGHRSLLSTAIYAKVDFHALDQVPLEWPEEKS